MKAKEYIVNLPDCYIDYDHHIRLHRVHMLGGIYLWAESSQGFDGWQHLNYLTHEDVLDLLTHPDYNFQPKD